MAVEWTPKYKTGDYILNTSGNLLKIIEVSVDSREYTVEGIHNIFGPGSWSLWYYYVEAPEVKYLGNNEAVVRLLHQYK